jgi:hypothetical protein
VLVGVTVAACLVAVIQYLFTRANNHDAQLALRWLTGSLNAADWPTIGVLALFLACLLPLAGVANRAQRIVELGHDTSIGLGMARRTTDVLLLLGVLLTALSVAAAGPVLFVAFVSGPIARALNRGRGTILGGALVGSAVVLGADYIAAYAIPNVNLPVGVVTGAFGAPFMLWLIARGKGGRRRWRRHRPGGSWHHHHHHHHHRHHPHGDHHHHHHHRNHHGDHHGDHHGSDHPADYHGDGGLAPQNGGGHPGSDHSAWRHRRVGGKSPDWCPRERRPEPEGRSMSDGGDSGAVAAEPQDGSAGRRPSKRARGQSGPNQERTEE